MFDFIVNEENSVQAANRIFNMRLYNLFLSQEELNNAIHDVTPRSRNEPLRGGRLDMDRENLFTKGGTSSIMQFIH